MTTPRRILVWDLPTRAFHWLLVVSFFGAYLVSGGLKRLMLHVVLGATVFGLIVFRVLWGFVGTRYARFASFTFGRPHVATYMRELLRGTPQHHLGHNPAGSWAVYGLLGICLATTGIGYATLAGPNWRWLLGVHQVLGNVALALVGVHIAGVLVSSYLHRENLARAMVTGEKDGRPEDGVGGSVWIVGVLLIALVLGFWAAAWRGDVSWLSRPVATFRAHHAEHHR